MEREIAIRQRIMNVAKDWERLPKAMIVGVGDGFEGMVGRIRDGSSCGC